MSVILKAEEGLCALGLEGVAPKLKEKAEDLGWQPVLNELLIQAFSVRNGGKVAALSPPPEVSAKDSLALRALMDAIGVPVSIREDFLSLHRHLFLLDHVEKSEFRQEECVYLASKVVPSSVLDLLEYRKESERRELLELAFEDAGLTASTLDCLLGSEALDPDHPEAKKAANALRWYRIYDGLTDKWAAWTRLPALLRPSRATLTIQITLPGAPPLPASCLVGKEIINIELLQAPRGAQARRRTAVQSIAKYLRSGKSVVYLANNTTQESRRAAIQAAREAGARVEILFYGGSIQSLYESLERAHWPVPERAFTRAASVFEAPRPHEAEVVQVYDERGINETWTVEVDGSITRELVEAIQGIETPPQGEVEVEPPATA